MVNDDQVDVYGEEGYLVVKNLFSPEEVELFREHFMEMRAAGTYPGDFAGVDLTSTDPLKRFPRMIHMHKFDEISLNWMLDDRLREWLTALMGREPYAVQTMLYFKPAGGRGQALHQDNFYLRVQPGTCIAAWLALDPCDEANGCMRVVPGSHKLPLLCTTKADTTQSFTDVTVPIPEGTEVVPVPMQPGDVMFFNGSLIHGSYPNTTADRFRRSLIGHYIAGEAEKIGGFYNPAYRFNGTTLDFPVSVDAGPCGVWVDSDGKPAVEMRAPASSIAADLHE